MAEPENLLGDAEVWDDSLLIESWNDALEEYKKYHSIHAKRGHLKDLEQSKQPSTASFNGNIRDVPEKGPEDSAATLPSSQPQRTPLPQGLPQALMGSIKDETLKKLLMSWYYAGYYTGLYEGQQQVSGEGAPSTSNPQP